MNSFFESISNSNKAIKNPKKKSSILTIVKQGTVGEILKKSNSDSVLFG